MDTSRDSTLSLTSDVRVLVVIDSNPIQISDAEGWAAVSLMLAEPRGMIAPFVAALGARVGNGVWLLMTSVRDRYQPNGESRNRPRGRLLVVELTGNHDINMQVGMPRPSPNPLCGAQSGMDPHCKCRDGETLIRRI
jgi:hypothetical protein